MNPKTLKRTFAAKLASSNLILKSHWRQLKSRGDRKQNRLRQTIEKKAAQWQANDKNADYLLRETALTEAQEFYIQSGDLLSFNSHKFIIESIQIRDRAAKQKKLYRQAINVTLTAGVMGVSLCLLPGASLNPTSELERFSILGTEEIISY